MIGRLLDAGADWLESTGSLWAVTVAIAAGLVLLVVLAGKA